jgi:hypothetical protein
VAYVGSNLVVEVKLLSVPNKVLSACFLKTFGFKPPYPCSDVRCERKCAQLDRPR